VASGGRQSPERQGDPEFGLFVVQRFGARTKSRGAKKSSAKFSSFDTFDPDKAFEEGELVVVNAPSGFAEGARSLGFVVLERIQLGSIGMTAFRVRIPPRTKMDAARRSLAGRFPGAIIDANHQFDMSAERRRSRSRTATGQKKKKAIQSRVRAAIGWQKVAHTCGRNVTLGMIDSGLDMSHPALKGQKIEFKSFHNRKRRQGNSNHGTAVAAILVGKPSNKGWGGLFPTARLKAANMFEFNKTGKMVGNSIGLLKSLNWLISKRVHVINFSIAGSDNKVVRRAMSLARKSGVPMVAAVGNWGRADKPAFPAAYPDVVAVTAVGPYRAIYKKANTGNYVDFAAPGVKLWTATPGGGGKYQSGTSFSAPFLTAIVGLEAAAGRKTDAEGLRGKLARGSKDLGKKGKDKTYGFGFVERKPNCRA
jgi:hypothetical protein